MTDYQFNAFSYFRITVYYGDFSVISNIRFNVIIDNISQLEVDIVFLVITKTSQQYDSNNSLKNI